MAREVNRFAAGVCGCLAALLLLLPGPARAGEKITFRAVTLAVLNIDGRPAKIWDVYLGGKRKELIIIRLGTRYLLMDSEKKEVYEAAPESFTRKEADHREALEWDADWPAAEKLHTPAAPSPGPSAAAPAQTRRLPSEEWSIRNVGPARRFRFKLTEEGRTFDLQLPLKPDGSLAN